MAMSFSRPDPSEPASVADASFSTGRRGFDQAEVRDFLRMVAAELGRLQERERFLERELRSAQSSPDLTSAALTEDDLTRLLGDETARVIATARESAMEIKAKAEQAAARMVSEAGDEANRLREEADLEASRRRADANSDAEAEIAMAKQQGRDMVNEARSYRERVLSELARRRELAREQIEQLLHGRDRLMQSFERARLVAVDVVAELQPLGEPDEYVNLSPTTGPVPVMVASAKAPGEQDPVGSFADFDRADEADDLPDAEPETGEATDEEVADDDAEPDLGDAEGDTVTEIDEEDRDPVAEVETDEAQPTADRDEAADDAEVTADADEIADDAAVTADADEIADDAAATAGADEIADDAEEPGEAEAEQRDSDDVVVDLFARLRAGTEEEAAPEPGDADETADDTTTESVAIGEAPDTGPAIADHAGDSEPSVFDQRDEDLTPLIVAGAKKLKRVLADEQNDLLDVLRRDDSVGTLDDLLPAMSEHVARYADAVADDLVTAAQAGASSAGATRKLRAATSKLAGTQARAVLQDHLITPLRDRLERVLSDASGDNDQITRSSRAIYREWKTQHIDEQLDDVFRAAYGRGRLAGFPDGAHVVWTVDPSAPSCPDCDDNVLGGAVVAGSEFPTGDIFAPAHPGCRCLLTAVER